MLFVYFRFISVMLFLLEFKVNHIFYLSKWWIQLYVVLWTRISNFQIGFILQHSTMCNLNFFFTLQQSKNEKPQLFQSNMFYKFSFGIKITIWIFNRIFLSSKIPYINSLFFFWLSFSFCLLTFHFLFNNKDYSIFVFYLFVYDLLHCIMELFA